MAEMIFVGIYMTIEQKEFISKSGNASFFIRKLIDEKKELEE